jgi:hypothetical protein
MTSEDDTTTESTATRWDYTNDVLAGLIVLGFLAIVGYAVYSSTVPVSKYWLGPTLAAGFIFAIAWLFGDKGADVINQLRGGR